ncbi:MAG: iron-sulfur cluster repair di-iron protein [Rhodospirillales bacterium]
MNRQTVGEIAAETPASVRVFEKYKIDYCCGGNRPLEEVCRERGISPEAVLAEVQAAAARAPEKDWTKAALSELIEHIVSTHHEYLKAELPALDARLSRVIEAHSAAHGEMLKSLQGVFDGLQNELLTHLRKEEFILFPAIESAERAREEGRPPEPLPFGHIENPIRMMIHEHDSAGEALAQMRKITGGYTLPPDACATFRALYTGLQELEADLHQHIHLENNVLFPRALREV